MRALRAAAIESLGLKNDLPAQSSLAEIYAAARARTPGGVFVILDQFEDYFFYHAEEDTRDFEREWSEVFRDPRPPAHLLISVREDSLGRLDRLQERIPELLSNLIRVDDMSVGAIRESITGPLRQTVVEADADLPEEIMREARVIMREPGARIVSTRIDTSYVQLALTRLWEEEMAQGSRRLRVETLHRLGGVTGIANDHLERILGTLSPEEQRAVAAISGFLVTPSGVRLAFPVRDLAAFTELPEMLVARVINLLCSTSARLIVRIASHPDDPSPETRYQIMHDEIARGMGEWRRRQLAGAERRRERRRLAVALSLASLLILILGIALPRFRQGNAALVGATFAGEARNLVRQGRAREALAMYGQALDRYRDLGNKSLVSDTLHSMAEAYAALGDSKRSAEYRARAQAAER